MGVDTIVRRAVFVDRDGVLNRAVVREGKPYPPSEVSELEILPGVREAVLALKRAGFRLVMVTNQPDVARGKTPRRAVERINAALSASLPLDDVRVCYHDDTDQCRCRKPLPGLLVDAARDWDIDLPASFMVGDRWRDIEAGRRAGCRTIFIDWGYAESMSCRPDFTVKSMTEAAAQILELATEGEAPVHEKA